MMFDVDGKKVEAMELRPGMNLTATKIVESPRTEITMENVVTGVGPKKYRTLNRASCSFWPAPFLVIAVVMAAPALAQGPPRESDRDKAVADAPAETVDVFDLVRKLRHKEGTATESWDYRKPMMAFAPVIGAKPSSRRAVRAAGNVAFYRGDPATTISPPLVTSVTFSTESNLDHQPLHPVRPPAIGGAMKELSLSVDLTGTPTPGYERRHATSAYRPISISSGSIRPSYRRLRDGLFAGAGLLLRQPHRCRAARRRGRRVEPSLLRDLQSRHTGFRSTRRLSAGPSVDLLWDNRDSFINAEHGWLAKASYRPLFDGFLGGDSSWQKVNLDVRTYLPLSRDGRHTLAFWAFADLVVGGVAPFYLPATAATPTAVPPADTPKASSGARSSLTAKSSIAQR